MGLYHTVFGLFPYSQWYWSLYKKIGTEKSFGIGRVQISLATFSPKDPARAIITTIVIIMIKMVLLAGGCGVLQPLVLP